MALMARAAVRTTCALAINIQHEDEAFTPRSELAASLSERCAVCGVLMASIRETQTATICKLRSGRQERAMPMLLWFPMIVMAGLYRAMSDDISTWQRAMTNANNREDV